jgi:hypothetical protein
MDVNPSLHLGPPQLTVLILWVIGILRAIHMHGKMKTGTENGVASVIAGCITLSLLYWGGFFTSH